MICSRIQCLRRGLLVSLAIAVAACSSSPSTSPETETLPGRYTANWSRSAANCVPKSLPTPLSTDSSLYARVPMSPLTFQLIFDVAEAPDSVVSLTPVSASSTTLALSGPLSRPMYTATLRRAGTLTEGARDGAHTFFVSEVGSYTAQFVNLVQTPPGNHIEVHFTATGTGTAVFREGSASGPIYTTCTFPETIQGAKILED